MPRALRQSIPGAVWHITHRCHNKAFLFKSRWTRCLWVRWLFEARRRFNLRVLNYTVTRNHIHLLLQDRGTNEIPPALQLIAGRTAQAYNRRYKRAGAFWESRYHPTLVAADHHFCRCLVYIDLNMVRAGVVTHPGEWPQGGYHEIQLPKSRYRIIDHEALIWLTGCRDYVRLAAWHRDLVTTTIREKRASQREPIWTESAVVGDDNYVATMEKLLGIDAPDAALVSRVSDAMISYNTEKCHLRFSNAPNIIISRPNP